MTETPSSAWVGAWQQTESLLALREFSDVSRRVMPALARRAGLTQTEMTVLESLIEGPMGPSEMAQRLGVTTAAASGIVDRLVSHGHAERTPHPDDKRRTMVAITVSGREELVGHLMPMFAQMAQLDAGFTDEERAVVRRYLEGSTKAMGRLL
ncbi:MAG: MarR family transcriptional regulator [Nakamurella sp.]